MRSSKDGLREESRKARADVGLPVAPLASTLAGTASRTRRLRVRIRRGQTPSGIQSPPPQSPSLGYSAAHGLWGPEAPWQHLTHCSSLNSPEFLIYVTIQRVFGQCPPWFTTHSLFSQRVFTPTSPPGQPQPHRFLKLSCTLILLSKLENPRDFNSPLGKRGSFAIPQNSYHGPVTFGIQGPGTSWWW